MSRQGSGLDSLPNADVFDKGGGSAAVAVAPGSAGFWKKLWIGVAATAVSWFAFGWLAWVGVMVGFQGIVLTFPGKGAYKGFGVAVTLFLVSVMFFGLWVVGTFLPG